MPRLHLALLSSAAIWLAMGALGAGLAPSLVYAQRGASLSGTVTEAGSGRPVADAAITLYPAGDGRVLAGMASGADGRYRLQGLAPGRYRLAIRAAGHRPAQRRIRLEAGRTETLDVVLHPAPPGPREAVPTPTVRSELERDASLPVSVVGEAALRRSAALAPMDGLRAVPGVHLVPTGLGQRQLALPAAGHGALGGPLVLVDGRRAGLPASGASVVALLPAPIVDLKRVEVVPGGTAVRGPAARAGVIHAITKDPFDGPGTAIAVTGGAPGFTQAQLRHAAVIGSTFGYEVVTHGAQGTNWPFEHNTVEGNPWGAASPDEYVGPTTGRPRRDDSYWTAGIHGEAAYQLNQTTTITARGGYTALTGPLYADWGPVQADPLGYAFTQLRLETHALHAHVGLNNTQAGTSYRYGTGQAITNRDVAYDARLRYCVGRPHWATTLTLGADGHWVRPRTRHSIMGQYEERDAVDRYGAFGTARTALSSWLTLSYAARADVDNLSAAVWPAVQGAVIADITPGHTVRFHYERGASAPRASTLFTDTGVYRQALGGGYRLMHRARGAVGGFSFGQYRRDGQVASLIPARASFGTPMAASAISLRTLYAAALPRLAAAWTDPAAQPASVRRLAPAQRQQLIAALGDLANAFDSRHRTTGALGLPDGRGGYRALERLRDIAPLQRPIAQTMSVGYRGTMGERVEVAARAYAGTIKNAIRPQMVSPLVYTPQVRADLELVLAPIVAQAASDPEEPLGRLLDAMGITPAEGATLTAQAMGRVYDGVPVGVVRPDQAAGAVARESSIEQDVLLTYRNVGRLYQAGVRLGGRAALRDNLRVNGAFAARAHHQQREKSTSGAPVARLNAPRFEAHAGVDWTVGAWTVHATAHYAPAHVARSGWYAGRVDAAYPVDVGVRFDARRYVSGLSAQLAVQNVLNQPRRGLIEAPVIGRSAWLRITYAP